MKRTFTLDDAIQVARRAHEGQLDKSGRPYIAHPLRVMGALRDEHERMAAVLHDVIEDTDVTLADLTDAGCPAPVLAAVAANPIALAVKRADIADNMSPDRMARLDRATQERLHAKYTSALRLLDA
jgi:(p)ppGpp synthase/HD superfamily hydrolase